MNKSDRFIDDKRAGGVVCIWPAVKFILVFGIVMPLFGALPYMVFFFVRLLDEVGADSTLFNTAQQMLSMFVLVGGLGILYGALPSIASGVVLCIAHSKQILFGYWAVAGVAIFMSALTIVALAGLEHPAAILVLVLPALLSASIFWALRHKLGYGYLGQPKAAVQQVSNDGNAVNE